MDKKPLNVNEHLDSQDTRLKNIEDKLDNTLNILNTNPEVKKNSINNTKQNPSNSIAVEKRTPLVSKTWNQIFAEGKVICFYISGEEDLHKQKLHVTIFYLFLFVLPLLCLIFNSFSTVVPAFSIATIIPVILFSLHWIKDFYMIGVAMDPYALEERSPEKLMINANKTISYTSQLRLSIKTIEWLLALPFILDLGLITVTLGPVKETSYHTFLLWFNLLSCISQCILYHFFNNYIKYDFANYDYYVVKNEYLVHLVGTDTVYYDPIITKQIYVYEDFIKKYPYYKDVEEQVNKKLNKKDSLY